MCSTPFGITEMITRRAGETVLCLTWVLNAFRHHRDDHFPASCGPVRGFGCSTPFGITEMITCDGERQRATEHVLNAFRHHRDDHAAECLASRAEQSGCSTPFGITEMITGRRNGMKTSEFCAQRLSASQR